MKKFILTMSSAVALLASTNTKAQLAPSKSTLSIGPIVSMGASRISNVESSFTPSGAVGVSLTYSTKSKIGFNFQTLASVEGFSKDALVGEYPVTYRYAPLYIRMPLTVNYFFGEYGNRVRPKIYAGPSLGIKVGEWAGYSYENENIDKVKMESPDYYNTIDFGVTGGAGANIRVGKRTWLNLDAGFYQGVTNALNNKRAADPQRMDESFRNQNIRGSVGLQFGI